LRFITQSFSNIGDAFGDGLVGDGYIAPDLPHQFWSRHQAPSAVYQTM
jgi:hypothetical protein